MFDQEIMSGELSIHDAFNAASDTNVSGTQVLTTPAVPLLLPSSAARLLFITSSTSSLGETEMPHHKRLNESPPAGWSKPQIPVAVTGYCATKTGLNMVMREWVRILKDDPIKIWFALPGFLATGLGGVGADQLKKVCPSLTRTHSNSVSPSDAWYTDRCHRPVGRRQLCEEYNGGRA